MRNPTHQINIEIGCECVALGVYESMHDKALEMIKVARATRLQGGHRWMVIAMLSDAAEYRRAALAAKVAFDEFYKVL